MSNLKEYLDYPRFKNDKIKVLIINSGYFLIKDLAQGLVENNHEVKFIQLYEKTPVNPSLSAANKQARANFLDDFLLLLVKFKPDFILTVNLIGFDEDGILVELLEKFKILAVNWFVDTPLGILNNNKKFNSSSIFSFCWEKSYLKPFRKTFPKHQIEYLPYATNYTGKEVFKNSLGFYEISFVGNSMIEATNDWREKANLEEELIRKMLSELSQDPCNNYQNFEKIIKKYQIEGFYNITYLQFLSTMIYRHESFKYLEKNQIKAQIFGDSNWQKLNFAIHQVNKGLNYYSETPQLYKNSKISLNLTSTQMKTALNQRIYDVFALGGFLLTDYREDLDLVLPELEIANFRSLAELKDKIKFYLSHDSQRRSLALKAQTLILSSHRYQNRIKSMIEILKKYYREL